MIQDFINAFTLQYLKFASFFSFTVYFTIITSAKHSSKLPDDGLLTETRRSILTL